MKKYYVGEGSYSNQDNWVDEFNQKTTQPTGDDDVFFDDRSKVTIGFKDSSFWRRLRFRLLTFLEKTTFGIYQSPEPFFITKAKSITFCGGMVTIQGRVDFSPQSVATFQSGTVYLVK